MPRAERFFRGIPFWLQAQIPGGIIQARDYCQKLSLRGFTVVYEKNEVMGGYDVYLASATNTREWVRTLPAAQREKWQKAYDDQDKDIERFLNSKMPWERHPGEKL